MPAAIRLEPSFVKGDFAIARHGDLVITLWGGGVAEGNVPEFRNTIAKVIEERGQAVSLNVVRGLKVEIGDEDREASRGLLTEFAGAYLGAALVVEGGGAKMILTRSVVTTLMLAARVPVKHKVVDSIRAGVEWLDQLAGFELGVDVESFTAAVATFADAHYPLEPSS